MIVRLYRMMYKLLVLLDSSSGNIHSYCWWNQSSDFVHFMA